MLKSVRRLFTVCLLKGCGLGLVVQVGVMEPPCGV